MLVIVCFCVFLCVQYILVKKKKKKKKSRLEIVLITPFHYTTMTEMICSTTFLFIALNAFSSSISKTASVLPLALIQDICKESSRSQPSRSHHIFQLWLHTCLSRSLFLVELWEFLHFWESTSSCKHDDLWYEFSDRIPWPKVLINLLLSIN